MTTAKPVDSRSPQRHNDTVIFGQENRVRECATRAKALLSDPTISFYHKIKTLILLSTELGDSDDAYLYAVEAEASWGLLRRWNPVGQDHSVDEQLEELRASLDELLDRFKKDEKDKEWMFLKSEWEDVVEGVMVQREDGVEEWEFIRERADNQGEMTNVDGISDCKSKEPIGRKRRLAAGPSDLPAPYPCVKSLIACWEQRKGELDEQQQVVDSMSAHNHEKSLEDFEYIETSETTTLGVLKSASFL